MHNSKTHLAIVPDTSGNVVTVAKLVGESLAFVIEKETTNTSESLGSEELDLGIGILGVNETSGVDLNLLHIDTIGPNGKSHLVTITSAVVAVGGRKVVIFGSILLQKRVLAKVGGVTTRGKDDGALDRLFLSVLLVLDADDGAILSEKFSDTGLEHDLDTLRHGLCEILKTLELGVGNNHSRELSIATMGTGLGVTAETGDF